MLIFLDVTRESGRLFQLSTTLLLRDGHIVFKISSIINETDESSDYHLYWEGNQLYFIKEQLNYPIYGNIIWLYSPNIL